MSTVFSEKKDVIAERKFAIVKVPQKQADSPMPAHPTSLLPDYVLRVMRENNLTYPDVEKNAKRRNGTIGKSTVQQIAQGKTPNPGIFTLVELAWGLQRPVEEVIAHALGTPATENQAFLKSALANLWEMIKEMPTADQRFFTRNIQMLEREAQKVLSGNRS